MAELDCVVLLLIPRTAWLGALGELGVIRGALVSHLFFLGFEVKADGELLFYLAVVVFLCCAATLWLKRGDLIVFIRRFLG